MIKPKLAQFSNIRFLIAFKFYSSSDFKCANWSLKWNLKGKLIGSYPVLIEIVLSISMNVEKYIEQLSKSIPEGIGMR